MRSPRDLPGFILALASAAAVLTALGMVFLYAPREATMGDVQRIFTFTPFGSGRLFGFLDLSGGHPCIWPVGSAGDIPASSVEEADFITMAVLTGSLWGPPGLGHAL